MSKFSEFFKKHGYTYKAFFLALVTIPPAAMFLAWKIPDTTIVLRILLSLLVVFVLLLPFILGALGISALF